MSIHESIARPRPGPPLRATLLGLAFVLSSVAMPLHASAASPSEASVNASAVSAATLSVATGVVVGGTLSAVALSGEAVVSSLEVVGESVVVGLRASGNAAEATVRLGRDALEGSGAFVGGVVMLSAYATGTVLRCGGRIIGFIPNDQGRALIRSRRLPSRPYG